MFSQTDCSSEHWLIKCMWTPCRRMNRQHLAHKKTKLALKSVCLLCVFHSVTKPERRQEKQLIYKQNRQILVETFHKLGRIWLRRFWVALALANNLCHRTSYVFSKFYLFSFKDGSFSQVMWFVYGQIPNGLIIPIKHRHCRHILKLELNFLVSASKCDDEYNIEYTLSKSSCQKLLQWIGLSFPAVVHSDAQSQYMSSHSIIGILSRTGKKEFDVFLVSVECKCSGGSWKVHISANKQTQIFSEW